MSGALVTPDMGISTSRELSGAVNTTITFTNISPSTLTIYTKSLEWSNTADFAVLVNPTDGLIIWQFTTDGVRWQQMYAGNYRPQDGYIIPPKAVGNIQAIRLITSGIVGANYVRGSFDEFLWLDNGIDPRVYNGPYAITAQSFVESNGKRGLSYEASFTQTVNAGANLDFIFKTGQFITLIKTRQISFEGSGITARVFRGPTYTGGSLQTYYNLNDNLDLQIPTDVQIIVGSTVTVTGTEIAAPTYALGTASGAGNTVGTFALPGAERVLAPNTYYLLRVTNNDASPRKVAGYVSWFSGRISTQN